MASDSVNAGFTASDHTHILPRYAQPDRHVRGARHGGTMALASISRRSARATNAAILSSMDEADTGLVAEAVQEVIRLTR